ncbi:MAG: tRNA (adenosine(37)-N6)-threonylcarbamoyltransferase complex transferase subunit TsaD [Roseobacter sp.]
MIETVLALESSCDDTAAAVLRKTPDARTDILSSIVMGQDTLHAPFGGVVPEIAARAHAERLDYCVEQALSEASLQLSDIDAIAVTAGPGLIGGVVAGVSLAKGLATALQKPLYGVNHLAGHALTPRLTHHVPFPYLMLLVSGGHCQFLIVKGPDSFERLGGTIDDAPGEAFDKTARLLGLDQPGGPSVEREALSGDPKRFKLPRPLLDRDGRDLSFSGLKTAVLRARDAVVAEHGGLPKQLRADLCAGFQASVVDVLAEKSRRAMSVYLNLAPDTPSLCVAGGVAANKAIRASLEAVAQSLGAQFVAPHLSLCTDNAAMIGHAALEQMAVRSPDTNRLSARPRWPLDTAQPSMLGSGKKGAKA